MKHLSGMALLILVVLSPLVSLAESQEIRVGVFSTDPKMITDIGKIMDYVSKRAGVKLVVIPITGYERSVKKLANGDIDAAVFGSAPAYLSIMKGIAEPIARPEIRKSSVYYGYWLTLKNSGLKKVEEFKGRSFAYVDPFTSAGYFFPRAVISAKGFDPDNFFGTVKFSKTHEAAIQMLLNGAVEGCAAKDTAYKKFIDTNIELKDKLNILEVAGPFPERTLMVSKRVEEGLRKKIKEALLGMNGDAEGKNLLRETGRDRYVETKLEDFAAIEKILKNPKVGTIN